MAKKKKPAEFAEVLRSLLVKPVGFELSGLEGLPPLEPNTSHDEAIAMALITKAMRGDTAAAKYIAETAATGDEKTPKVELVLKVVR